MGTLHVEIVTSQQGLILLQFRIFLKEGIKHTVENVEKLLSSWNKLTVSWEFHLHASVKIEFELCTHFRNRKTIIYLFSDMGFGIFFELAVEIELQTRKLKYCCFLGNFWQWLQVKLRISIL